LTYILTERPHVKVLRCVLNSIQLFLHGNQSRLLRINMSSFSNGGLQLQHDGRQPNAGIEKAFSKQPYIMAHPGSDGPAHVTSHP
jgi:hypothetical protein